MFKNAYISGMGVFLPENIQTNFDLYKKISGFDPAKGAKSLSSRGVETDNLSDEEIFDLWVQQVCGIKQRTILNEQELIDNGRAVEIMAERASRKALAEAGLEVDQIDHIVLASYSSDALIPPPVCGVADRLGINDKVSGITVNGACSGFLDGLIDAASKISSGLYTNVLVVASEYVNNKINYDDPTTAILFSDGAGAAVVSAGKDGFYGASSRIAYSAEHINMERVGKLHMGGGPLVQRRAVNAMNLVATEALEKAGMKYSDMTRVVPHQANLRILNALEDKMGISGENKMVKSIHLTGNLSSATIPVALDFLRRGELEQSYEKGKYLLTAVGGGYTYSSIVVDV